MEGNLDKKNKGTTSYEVGGGVAVDVTGYTRTNVTGIRTKEDPDETEYSSSFADSVSGQSDAEADSHFCNESDFGSPFDGFGCLFPMRKKKLTSHWRNFISPLMWRCKWVEVKLREFKSQAKKYDRLMSTYDRGKHKVLDQFLLQESGSKAIPYIHQSKSRNAMKRRKRKRAEGTDVASYMSNHKLFSYFENKKSDPDGASAGDDLNSVLIEHNGSAQDEMASEDLSILKGNQDLPEQVLRKIEQLHARVHKLSSELDSVMEKNALKFSSSENLSNLCGGGIYEAQDSSVRNTTTFSACNGETMSAGFIMHDSAISSFGEANNPPDIVESSTGFLSFVDAAQNHQGQVGDSCEKIVDNILVQNEASEVEASLLTKMNQEPSSMEKNIATESENPAASQDHPPALRPCVGPEIHFPTTTSKRKRGERKAGGTSWNWQKTEVTEPESSKKD